MMKHGVTMRESSPFNILAGDTNMVARHKEGPVGEKLAQRPVCHSTFYQIRPALQHTLQARMHHKVIRKITHDFTLIKQGNQRY